MAIKPFFLLFSRVSFILLLSFQSTAFKVLAAPILFSDESAFNHAVALPDVYLDFEDRSPFGERVGGGVSDYTLPGITISAPLPAIKLLSRKYSGTRNTTVGGRNYLSIDTDLRRKGTTTRFDFDNALQSIGFYLIDHDASDAIIIVDGMEYRMPEVNDSEAAFFGLIFDQQSSIPTSLQIDSGQDSQIALDDLRFAYWHNQNTASDSTPVNEPNPVIMLLTGLLLLILLSTSQRQTVVT